MLYFHLAVVGVRANGVTSIKQRAWQPTSSAASLQQHDTSLLAASVNQATVERPDFSVKIPRINAPALGDYDITSDFQESEGGITHLHGHVVVELFDATFKADEARVRRKHEDLQSARQRLVPQLRSRRSDLLRPG